VPRLVLLLLGIAAVLLLRRRRAAEVVEVEFEDGAAIRLTSGVEARDLLDDARAILETAA
jgi:hypothetical protein